jgi:hypothetical protein
MPWINLLDAAWATNLMKTGEIFSPFVINTDLYLNKDLLDTIRTTLEIIVIFIAGIWAIFKILEFREFKHWIQFEIDANFYPLRENINANSYIWDEYGKGSEKNETFTHVLELLFKFNNKGKTRVKIYNIHAKISTLPPIDNNYLSSKDGHLRFFSIWTGNIVPEKKKFYYIEPQVEQTITYLTLIRKPKDIIRIHGEFCQDHERIYPKKEQLCKYFKYDNNETKDIPYPAIEEVSLLIRFINDRSYSLCKFLEKRYVFCWNEVPGKDNSRLIKFLSQKFYNIDFLKNEKTKIKKSEDEKTIKLFDDNHYFSMTLNLLKTNDEEQDVILEIDGIKRKNRLFIKVEDDKILNIYERRRYDPIYGWILRSIYNRHCRRLLSHTSERTFFIDSNGCIRK